MWWLICSAKAKARRAREAAEADVVSDIDDARKRRLAALDAALVSRGAVLAGSGNVRVAA